MQEETNIMSEDKVYIHIFDDNDNCLYSIDFPSKFWYRNRQDILNRAVEVLCYKNLNTAKYFTLTKYNRIPSTEKFVL